MGNLNDNVEQRALEFLAAEYERDGKAGSAEHIRTQPLLPNKARAVRAIAAALRHQPAPVDLEQFREAVGLMLIFGRDDEHARAKRLLALIDSAGKVEVDASFDEWLAKEMPAGTVIGDPSWWADRIARQYSKRTAQQPAAVVDEAMVDAAIAAQDAHWANDDNYPVRAPRSVKGDARLHDKLARGAMRAALTAALASAQPVPVTASA